MPHSLASFNKNSCLIITQFAALLQVKYQMATAATAPFPTAAMSVAAFSLLIYYLLRLAILLHPESPFAAAASYLLFCSAYVAISALGAALFPSPATPFIYSTFGLLSAGQLLYMLCQRLALHDQDDDDDLQEYWWSLHFHGRRVRRYVVKIYRVAASLFQHAPPPPILPI